MVVAATTGVWIGASHNGTVYPLVLTMAAFPAVLFATVFGWVARLGDRSAAPAAPGTR
jgi:hypothetical protein